MQSTPNSVLYAKKNVIVNIEYKLHSNESMYSRSDEVEILTYIWLTYSKMPAYVDLILEGM